MRKLLTFLLVCLFGLVARADAFSFLNFTSGTSTTQLNANGVKITFADGNLVATVDGATTTLPLSGLSNMYFTNDALSMGLKGDINHDGLVDLTDLNILINGLLSGNYTNDYDVNGDGTLDVGDIAIIINIIISQ